MCDIYPNTSITLTNKFDKLADSNYDDKAMLESSQNCIPDIEEIDIVPNDNCNRCNTSQDKNNTQPELLNEENSTIENCGVKFSSKGLHIWVGYNLQTKPCRLVDHGPVCSGPKGDILQTKYLADQTLCRLYSE